MLPPTFVLCVIIWLSQLTSPSALPLYLGQTEIKKNVQKPGANLVTEMSDR